MVPPVKKVVSDKFILFTVLVSLVLGMLYLWKGVKMGFPPFWMHYHRLEFSVHSLCIHFF